MPMDLHYLVHATSVALAAILTGVSVLSFARTGSVKLLIISLGFAVFFINELLIYFQSFILHVPELAFMLDHVEVPHGLTFAVLLLFALGTLKR